MKTTNLRIRKMISGGYHDSPPTEYWCITEKGKAIYSNVSLSECESYIRLKEKGYLGE